MAYSRYQRGGNQQPQAQAQAYINYTSKLPSGSKVKMESKKFFAHIPSHEEAIEVCRVNHDQTFEDKYGITHYWFVKPIDPTETVTTSWAEPAPAAVAPVAVTVEAPAADPVTVAIADVVASGAVDTAETDEDDIPF